MAAILRDSVVVVRTRTSNTAGHDNHEKFPLISHDASKGEVDRSGNNTETQELIMVMGSCETPLIWFRYLGGETTRVDALSNLRR